MQFPIGICLGLKDFFFLFLTEILTVAGVSLFAAADAAVQLLLLLLLVSGMSTVPALVLCH
jgi:hypothetical protein